MRKEQVDRLDHQRALADFFDAAASAPAALVISGDAGIGKSTCWLDALDAARRRGYTVLDCRSAAAESVLAYAGLADLLSEVGDAVMAALPKPQRMALETALLLRAQSAGTIDARAVAAAFASVIRLLAADSAVLIAIDDLQWLDSSSGDALVFATRRLPTNAALVCSTRTEQAAASLQLPSEGVLHRFQVQPLTVTELQHVIELHQNVPLARAPLLRIHEISAGNPFYALELAREFRARGHHRDATLPARLHDVVAARVKHLAPAADDVLLAAASVAKPTVQLLASVIGSGPERVVELLSDAEDLAVVAIDGNQVRFTHPLLAHGVYTGAPPRRRRAMHRRLSELVTEPELRARHLAMSSATAEPDVVDALDAAAQLAHGRGAPAAAAELLDLGMRLGADTPQRRILCAVYYFDAGDPGRARGLLTSAIEELSSGADRGEALYHLGVIRAFDDSLTEAVELLESALAEAQDDARLRVQILVTLSYTMVNAGRPDAADRIRQTVAEAELLSAPGPLSAALGMRETLHFMLGQDVDETALARAVGLESPDLRLPLPFRPHVQLTLLRAWTGDQLEWARDRMVAVGENCRAVGEEHELVFVGFQLTLMDLWLGRLTDAAQTALDTTQRAEQLGGDFPLFVARTSRAAVHAYAGRLDDARQDLDEAFAAVRRCGATRLAEWPATLAGFVEVSRGNYQGALDAVEPLVPMLSFLPGNTEIITASYVPEAIEAMVGVGRLDDAEPLVQALERNGGRLDRAWTLAVGMRCRAMLLAARGDVAGAIQTVESALAHHHKLPMPFEHARTQMLLGQLLRRQRRRDAAATMLREALETFERLGTHQWADRARAELARTTVSSRNAQGLTPTEQRIAELAATGLSDREIAAALFISPKTVEHNLGRVYRKLGVRSRAKLPHALDRSAAGPQAHDD